MVHIKRVDIYGFKSFGFKNTTVNFEPGLVSISGPNGSGKSNILDAIIFAMGENRPKIMRAPNLRALLHDIEGNRRGPKVTRVKLLFDNSDRKIPINSDNVTVTREMTDHGESTYYIDSKKINRSRVIDIFDVANAGLNQLNAVQQGTVTRISEMNNDEKRKTIEDLIGLSFFDEKKIESEKQLTAADQRLEVAMATMGQVKKQIDELEIERNLKLRHKLVERELQRFKAIDAASELKLVKSEKLLKEQNLTSNSSKSTELVKTRSTLKAEISQIESEKTDFSKKLDDYNKSKSSIDTELSTEQRKHNTADGNLKTNQKRIDQIKERLPEITTELEKMRGNQGKVDLELEEVKKSVQKIQVQKNTVDKKIENLDSERNTVLDHQSEVSAKKNEIDNKIQNLKNKLHDAQVSKSEAESHQKIIQNKINSNTAKNKINVEEISRLEQSSQKLSTISSTRQSTSSQIKSKISKFSSQKTKIANDIAELELILQKSSIAANRYNEKIKLVKSVMHEDYTISQLKADSKKLGIDGFVYEMLSWDKQYERAVLAVSSDWVKAVVVPDFETLVSLAQVARDKKLPKLKIIPLNTIPEFHMKLPKTSGLLGILSDYVQCDRKYIPIAKFLFGNVILTKTSHDAHELSKAGYKAVSINGEFFESKSSAVVIDINSKINKLTKIISQSSSVEGLFKTINLLSNLIQKKKSNLRKIDQIHGDSLERLQLAETEFGNASYSKSSLKSQINSTHKLNDQLSQRILELQKQKTNLSPKIIHFSSSIESLQQRIKLVNQNYSNNEQNSIANQLNLLNNKKSHLNSEQSKIMKVLSEETAKISVVEDRKRLRKEALLDEESSISEEKTNLESKITTFQADIDASDQALVKLRDKEQELISTSGTSVSQLSEYDEKLDVRNGKERGITNELNRLVRDSDGFNRDLIEIKSKESSLKKILDLFGFDESIETFSVEPFVEVLEKEYKALTPSLNAIAPQKYLEISTGYRTMSNRKNDLEAERNSIWAFIESVEKEKKQTFLDAFDTVDKEIRKIFTKMNGGNAWLELENEDDIFNSGVSYLIQFQNKPKRESTSISGGEKTLAAVVFVLGLQKLKPSPFYLFDEIDAHLDAPNAESLSKIVEERSHGSQFIMVSLKDSVVGKAKLIYGVYPKNGVSNVVIYKDKRMPSLTS
jgi:chromosome segregation protein